MTCDDLPQGTSHAIRLSPTGCDERSQPPGSPASWLSSADHARGGRRSRWREDGGHRSSPPHPDAARSRKLVDHPARTGTATSGRSTVGRCPRRAGSRSSCRIHRLFRRCGAQGSATERPDNGTLGRCRSPVCATAAVPGSTACSIGGGPHAGCPPHGGGRPRGNGNVDTSSPARGPSPSVPRRRDGRRRPRAARRTAVGRPDRSGTRRRSDPARPARPRRPVHGSAPGAASSRNPPGTSTSCAQVASSRRL